MFCHELVLCYVWGPILVTYQAHLTSLSLQATCQDPVRLKAPVLA